MSTTLTLFRVPGLFAVSRLGPNDQVPAWAWRGEVLSVTRTPDETSVLCHESDVPAGVQSERGWVGFAVAGPLDFDLTGVLASLAAPLADAAVPIFVVSTFDTDYLFVRRDDQDRAAAALGSAGHRLLDAPER